MKEYLKLQCVLGPLYFESLDSFVVWKASHVSNTCVKDLIFVALKASQWSISVAAFVNINYTWKSFIKLILKFLPYTSFAVFTVLGHS